MDEIVVNNLAFHLPSGEITSLIYNAEFNNTIFSRTLKENYDVTLINNIYKYKNKLVRVIIPNSKKSEDVIKTFKLNKIMDTNYDELDIETKALVMILTNLLTKKDIVVLDNILYYLSNKLKVKLFNYFKKNKLTILNITTDEKDILLSNNLILVNENKILLSGTVMDILKEDKKIKMSGNAIPFMYDLSLKLNLYELIDKIYLDEKKLVGALWK